MTGGCDDGVALEDEPPPSCPSAGLAPARRTSNSRPTGSTGRVHTSGLNCLSKNPHMYSRQFGCQSAGKDLKNQHFPFAPGPKRINQQDIRIGPVSGIFSITRLRKSEPGGLLKAGGAVAALTAKTFSIWETRPATAPPVTVRPKYSVGS